MKNRFQKVKSFFDARDRLTLKDPLYRQWVDLFTVQAFRLDLGKGDITTQIVFPEAQFTEAFIVAQDEGVFAGRQEIEYFFSQPLSHVRALKSKFFKKDGDIIKKGDHLLQLKGDVRDIAVVERTLLNVLQRMCGVAANAKRFVDCVKKISQNTFLAPTRKTLFGLLDKRACSVGGTLTHRLNLEDVVLIKDTHLNVSKKDFPVVFENIFKEEPPRLIEIEIENGYEALYAVLALQKYKSRSCFAALFDNMPTQEIERVLRILHAEKLDKEILFEASGGINYQNIDAYAKTGVDVLSIGALTLNVPPFSLHLVTH